MTFAIAEQGFELDGKPMQIISGALHYFRVHPSQWADRMDMACDLGLNAIETYVAWNFHSSKPGEFRLDGWRDLGAFLDMAGQRGLHAIVRPGPYICAEWRNAGFPSWLTAQDIALRTKESRFLAAVAQYFDDLLPVIVPRQVSQGGNVLMVQVENEYGAYGDDKEYLRAIADLLRERGIDVPLFTCDQASERMLTRGSLPELLATGTFGSRSLERLATLRRHQPVGPLMCMEYWNGWFDSWGQHHHVTDPEESAEDLAQLLAEGASVNLYMLHGGTNFELNNGANHKGTYTPIATSYDYDAPLSEDGQVTPKFAAFRSAIHHHLGLESAPVNVDRVDAPTFDVSLHAASSWTDCIGPAREYTSLPAFDEVEPEARFMLYECQITDEDRVLVFDDVRDRAYCFLDDEPVGSMDRTRRQRTIALPTRPGRLTLLVEDLGRVNYGQRLGEHKGLIGPCVSAVRDISDWRVAPVDLTVMGTTCAGEQEALVGPMAGPVLTVSCFDAPEGRDLFLSTRSLGTGVAWCNGQLLGRYWSAGPTSTLYIPGPIVHAERNIVLIWELEAIADPKLSFVAHPMLGHTEA